MAKRRSASETEVLGAVSRSSRVKSPRLDIPVMGNLGPPIQVVRPRDSTTAGLLKDSGVEGSVIVHQVGTKVQVKHGSSSYEGSQESKYVDIFMCE